MLTRAKTVLKDCNPAVYKFPAVVVVVVAAVASLVQQAVAVVASLVMVLMPLTVAELLQVDKRMLVGALAERQAVALEAAAAHRAVKQVVVVVATVAEPMQMVVVNGVAVAVVDHLITALLKQIVYSEAMQTVW
jgi:hypothetical protein